MVINKIECTKCEHRKVCMYVKSYYEISNQIDNIKSVDGFSVSLHCDNYKCVDNLLNNKGGHCDGI